MSSTLVGPPFPDMPPFRPWAALPPELLCLICDNLELKCYSSARGACTAWRCTLVPPTPSLLIALDDAMRCPSATSVLMRRSFELKDLPSGSRCVGSSSGWLALSGDGPQGMFSLFNPVTATEVILPPFIYGSSLLSKIVFTPNPARDDFAAATICDVDRLAYVTAGARRWAILDPVCLAVGDRLVDVMYHEKGRVYCLTSYGDVHVLHLPERRRREPVMVDDPSSVPAIPSHVSDGVRTVLDKRRTDRQLDMLLMRSLGPDLNAPATIEPLLFHPFDTATCFAPAYSKVSDFTSAKNLVFCDGNLYQIWRNTSCTVTINMPGGGRRRVVEDEVCILRYYPRRQPCWDAVMDLGGYSVFLGRNNAVSMYVEAFPGLKGNCVYWIGGRGRDQGMVFDMATGRSTPCLSAAAGGAPQSTICWYFLG